MDISISVGAQIKRSDDTDPNNRKWNDEVVFAIGHGFVWSQSPHSKQTTLSKMHCTPIHMGIQFNRRELQDTTYKADIACCQHESYDDRLKKQERERSLSSSPTLSVVSTDADTVMEDNTGIPFGHENAILLPIFDDHKDREEATEETIEQKDQEVDSYFVCMLCCLGYHSQCLKDIYGFNDDQIQQVRELQRFFVCPKHYSEKLHRSAKQTQFIELVKLGTSNSAPSLQDFLPVPVDYRDLDGLWLSAEVVWVQEKPHRRALIRVKGRPQESNVLRRFKDLKRRLAEPGTFTSVHKFLEPSEKTFLEFCCDPKNSILLQARTTLSAPIPDSYLGNFPIEIDDCESWEDAIGATSKYVFSYRISGFVYAPEHHSNYPFQLRCNNQPLRSPTGETAYKVVVRSREPMLKVLEREYNELYEQLKQMWATSGIESRLLDKRDEDENCECAILPPKKLVWETTGRRSQVHVEAEFMGYTSGSNIGHNWETLLVQSEFELHVREEHCENILREEMCENIPPRDHVANVVNVMNAPKNPLKRRRPSDLDEEDIPDLKKQRGVQRPIVGVPSALMNKPREPGFAQKLSCSASQCQVNHRQYMTRRRIFDFRRPAAVPMPRPPIGPTVPDGPEEHHALFLRAVQVMCARDEKCKCVHYGFVATAKEENDEVCLGITYLCNFIEEGIGRQKDVSEMHVCAVKLLLSEERRSVATVIKKGGFRQTEWSAIRCDVREQLKRCAANRS